VHVISDAQRGDVFTGTYERSTESRWNGSSPPVIVAAQTWLEARGPNDVLSGPALSLHGQHAPVSCRVLSEPMWIPRAGTIARIGMRQIQEGGLADCMTLEPFYLRRSAAEERIDPSQP
jgi:tRNA threonylcarbamoyladenosine biosynthesis protein TsaB